MTDGIQTGWSQAAWALGYLIGAIPVLAALALLLASIVWLILVTSVDLPHWLRVRRLHREARRAGRTRSDADLLKLKARAGTR